MLLGVGVEVNAKETLFMSFRQSVGQNHIVKVYLRKYLTPRILEAQLQRQIWKPWFF